MSKITLSLFFSNQSCLPLLWEPFNYSPHFNNVSLLMMFHILYSLACPLIMSPPFNNTVVSGASARGFPTTRSTSPWGLCNGQPPWWLQPWQRTKVGDNTQSHRLSSLADPKFTQPCPHTACISSLPPVRQMSGCSNLNLLNGIEAGHGTAEQLLPERLWDKFAPSAPFYLYTSSIQLSLFLT